RRWLRLRRQVHEDHGHLPEPSRKSLNVKPGGFFKITESPHFLHLDFYAPDSANALSLAAVQELAKIQKSYKSWSQPVVISSALSGVFCSGGNLSEYAKLKNKAAGLKVNREIEKGLNVFASWP